MKAVIQLKKSSDIKNCLVCQQMFLKGNGYPQPVEHCCSQKCWLDLIEDGLKNK